MNIPTYQHWAEVWLKLCDCFAKMLWFKVIYRGRGVYTNLWLENNNNISKSKPLSWKVGFYVELWILNSFNNFWLNSFHWVEKQSCWERIKFFPTALTSLWIVQARFALRYWVLCRIFPWLQVVGGIFYSSSFWSAWSAASCEWVRSGRAVLCRHWAVSREIRTGWVTVCSFLSCWRCCDGRTDERTDGQPDGQTSG